MNEYRREIKHRPDSEYAWVDLGPIPGYPSWHVQSEPTSYPFPTNEAAHLFASGESGRWPGREVSTRER